LEWREKSLESAYNEREAGSLEEKETNAGRKRQPQGEKDNRRDTEIAEKRREDSTIEATMEATIEATIEAVIEVSR
jgi:hypothetical protein